MTFQKSIQRQFTLGFPGEIVRDGTLRAKPGRIGGDKTANATGNVVGFVFGYKGETGTPANELVGKSIQAPTGAAGALAATGNFYDNVAETYEVVAGGDNFFGILAHPKHYALVGTVGGSLEPTLDLPFGTEGEFVDMTAGIVVRCHNATATAINPVEFGSKVGYVGTASGATFGLKPGMIVAYSGTKPAWVNDLPGAKVIKSANIPASSASAIGAAQIVLQLTN